MLFTILNEELLHKRRLNPKTSTISKKIYLEEMANFPDSFLEILR